MKDIGPNRDLNSEEVKPGSAIPLIVLRIRDPLIFLPLDPDPEAVMQKKSRAGIRYEHPEFYI